MSIHVSCISYHELIIIFFLSLKYQNYAPLNLRNIGPANIWVSILTTVTCKDKLVIFFCSSALLILCLAQEHWILDVWIISWRFYFYFYFWSCLMSMRMHAWFQQLFDGLKLFSFYTLLLKWTCLIVHTSSLSHIHWVELNAGRCKSSWRIFSRIWLRFTEGSAG